MGRSAAVGCFASLLGLGLAPLGAAPAAAQNQRLVVRDGTVGPALPPGSDGIVVAPGFDDLGDHADYLIRADLGEQHGGNLFHSFSKFSIGGGERAAFTGQGAPDPGGIDNVISRVTGPYGSRIDGKLSSTIPGADVWLLNPRGVFFGEGASLDVSGSFHASAGDYVGFGEGEPARFYADGRPSVLSAARPEAFGFLEESMSGPIAAAGAGLAVDAGETIELAGGDVTLTAATLAAPGGNISIRGGRIVVEEGSEVLAENAGEDPAGTIGVEASESLLVDDSLLSVNTTSSGDAGAIHVASPSVTFRNGPGFFNPENVPDQNAPEEALHPTEVGASAETAGSGEGGTIEIEAGELVVTDGASVSARSFERETTGKAGQIYIQADSMTVSGRADVSAAAWDSDGDAGTIDIEVANDLVVDGSDDYALLWTSSSDPSVGFADRDPATRRVPGAPGKIEIRAGHIKLTDGGAIESACWYCSSQRQPDGVGAAPEGVGAIGIRAEDMLVEGGNSLSASYVSVAAWEDAGDAGDIDIDLEGALRLLDGGHLAAIVGNGSGDAGTITIHAESVALAGLAFLPDLAVPAGIRVDTNLTEGGNHIGSAGDIAINARSLIVASGAQVNAGALTTLSGRAGTIGIDVETLHVGPHPDFPVEFKGRKIPLSLISASSLGQEGAGTVDIEATESILVTYERGLAFDLDPVASAVRFQQAPYLSGIFSATLAGGEGGDISLRAPDITMTKGGIVATSTVGGGNGGSIGLDGARIRVLEGAFVDSTAVFNNIISNQPGGDAGDVTITASESIEVAGRRQVGRENADRKRVQVDDWSRVASASIGSGAAGTVTLSAPRFVIDGGAVATTALPDDGATDRGGSGGNIQIATGELVVRGGGRIDASSFVGMPGGDIDISADESIRVEGEGSGIASRSGGAGEGGGVSLTAPRIAVSDGGEVEARSEAGLGEVAAIFRDLLNAPDFIDESLVATGDAGSVGLTAKVVRLFDGTLATNSEAADGGNLTIEAKGLVHLDAGEITAAVTDGLGGNITIDPEVVILQNGSRIVADAGAGDGGNIRITADNYFAFPGTVVDASSDLGLDGVVEVNTPDVNLAGALAELPSNPLDAASQMKEPCAARRSGERAGSFAVRGAEGIPPEPDGWLPATGASHAASGKTSVFEEGQPGSASRFAVGGCR